MNHVDWVERGLIESAMVRLNGEALAGDFELMRAEITTLCIEKCSLTMEASAKKYSNVGSRKKEMPKKFNVFLKSREGLADMNLECPKQDNQNSMNVQNTEAERLSD